MTLVGMVGTLDVSYDREPSRALKAATTKLSRVFGALPGKSTDPVEPTNTLRN